MQIEYFECNCYSPDHTLKFYYDPEVSDEWEDIYVCVFLESGGLWNRLKEGIKYIFGYKCKYGHFDEFLLSYEDVPKLQAVLDRAMQKCSGKG